VRPAPILNPAFVWIGSDTHTDPSAFAERQRARMKAAQQKCKPASNTPRNKAAEAEAAAIRG
jgi:hypothetical protein